MPASIAGHDLRFDAQGELLPWTSWLRALDLEMDFYRGCPADRGYPRFVHVTMLDDEWHAEPGRTDTIPATQNGMGILSYLKFRTWRGSGASGCLAVARRMGDYLVDEALTPDDGAYPAFVRSTGIRDRFPQPADCGSQADRPHEIEPDKGGIAAYALLQLAGATGVERYYEHALHHARVLAARQGAGGAAESPWPFRADWRDGAGRGRVAGNMTYILRLYDALLARGHREFAAPRRALWAWIRDHQIPSAAHGGALFAQFFEDHATPTNRTAWAPLNLARYLIERRADLDPDWREQAALLIGFVRRRFTHREYGITVCHEQDEDRNAWGGVAATYGAVLALFAAATDDHGIAREARQALNFVQYTIDAAGRPRDLFKRSSPGGWQEDAHTDVIHNVVDALRAQPAWAWDGGGA